MTTINRTVAYDVIVVGVGNAGLAAALAAHEAGARVLALEATSKDERGGNSRFSGGMLRFAHDGFDSVAPLITDRTWSDQVEFGPYTTDDYYNDIMSLSENLSDPVLVRTLVDDSYDVVTWLHKWGVPFRWHVGKALNPDVAMRGGKLLLRNSSPAVPIHEGQGLVAAEFGALEAAGVEIWYDSPVADLLFDGRSVNGVLIRREHGYDEVTGKVILAAGGFEANSEMRLRYLGDGWDLVKVRGSKYNSGDMLMAAMAGGAKPVGHWGGAHAVPIDANAPASGDLGKTDKTARYSYVYGISINRLGERFIDEGEDDFRHTYAKTGWAVRRQPGTIAHQIFDQKTVKYLEKRYSTGTPIIADTIGELAVKLGVDPDRMQRTVDEFNTAAPDDDLFDPLRNDGMSTKAGLQPPKSNWAIALDTPPYVAYSVTCGITFTYGGIKISPDSQVIDNQLKPIGNLWATGEIVGDLFHFNYPAGAGLMLGAAFGRRAGRAAAAAALGSERP